MASAKDLIEIGKSFFSLVRDFSIFGVLVALFAVPSCVNTQLTKAGIVKGNFLGFEWVQKATEKSQAETKEIADRMQQLKQDNDALQAKIASLSQMATTPALSQAVAEIKQDAVNSASAIRVTDAKIAKSLVTQQQILQQSGVAETTKQGWLFLGLIDQQKTSWVGNGRASSARWPLSAGAEITIIDDVYLHGDTTTAQRREGAVLGAVKVGTRLKILEIDTSKHMLRGGWAVWVRVEAPV